MIRLSTLFWLVAVAAAGFAMFAVKYQVQALADGLARTARQVDETERDIRVLDAEWAYLNRPDALAQMNQRFLSLVPIATKQLHAALTDIPMRPAPPPVPPPPAPPPAPVVTVAAVPASAVAQTAAPQSSASDAAAPAASSAEVVAASTPATPAPPAQDPPAVVAVALDTQAAARSVKPAPARAARPSAPHHAASLNELIAQIAESR